MLDSNVILSATSQTALDSLVNSYNSSWNNLYILSKNRIFGIWLYTQTESNIIGGRVYYYFIGIDANYGYNGFWNAYIEFDTVTSTYNYGRGSGNEASSTYNGLSNEELAQLERIYSHTIMTTFLPSSLGGGPVQGYSRPMSMTGVRDHQHVAIRRVLLRSWNNQQLGNSIVSSNGETYNRITTPFRAANNLGDFLGRQNYSCGGGTQTNAGRPGMARIIRSVPNQCDTTGIPAATCNTKFVADSSSYTTYKKQRAIFQNYNDIKDGGSGKDYIIKYGPTDTDIQTSPPSL